MCRVSSQPFRADEAYVKMADDPGRCSNGWAAYVEWGVDVPRGEETDMYRAHRGWRGDHLSWNAWPTRRDAAAEQMMEEMKDFDASDMPFDGMRMMWGGFEKIFDSAEAG